MGVSYFLLKQLNSRMQVGVSKYNKTSQYPGTIIRQCYDTLRTPIPLFAVNFMHPEHKKKYNKGQQMTDAISNFQTTILNYCFLYVV